MTFVNHLWNLGSALGVGWMIVAALTTKGVVLHADRDAFDRRELDADQLREGAVLAAPADLARLVAEGRVPVHV